MARPTKTGLDYFSLDVTLDDSVELIEAEFGLQGYAIILKLWQKIYSEGYYIDWKKDNIMLFSRRINSEETLVTSIVNSCLDRGIFNKLLFEKYEVLTSNGIQKRYLTACKQIKRSNISLHQELILVNDSLSSFITEITSIFPVETIVLDSEPMAISTQKKGKEKKGEERKGNEKKEEETPVVIVDEKPNIFIDYARAGFGVASSTQADQLIELEDTYGYEWTRDAIKEAALNNILRITYVEGILKNWKAKGRNSQKPQYKNGKEVKKDFTERDYDYKQEEEKLLGWSNIPEKKSDGEDILTKLKNMRAGE